MRLLNTQTLKLERFLGSNIPSYVILSHTWEEEEVSLQDLSSRNTRTIKGWAKIEETCHIALTDDKLKYA